MSSNYITVPLIFLIDSVFSLYILAIMLRFLLQWVKADFRNPITQALVTATHPPLKFLRRFIPSLGKIDTASLVLALALQILTLVSILVLQGVKSSAITVVVISCAHLLELTLNIFIFAIFAQAVLSWFNTDNVRNPAVMLLTQLTQPILTGCRKVVPEFSGLDFSPLAALLLLQLTKMLLMPPLEKIAYLLA